jgi:hypothetical protein
MTDTQLYPALGVPIFAILTSLTVSLVQVSGIREDMRAMRQESHQDLRDIRSDISTLTGKVVEIDNRLTRIEERLEHR